MDLKAKYSLLLKELEGFFVDDVVAITHGDWALYQKLLKKKQHHLKAIRELSPKVGKECEADRIARIKERALAAYNLMEEKYAEKKAEYARLERAKFRIKSIKSVLKKSSGQQLGTRYA